MSTLWLLCMSVAQSCPTLCDPVGCSLPGSSIHRILQARMLEWVAISFSRGIFPFQESNPCLLHCRWILYHWTTGEAHVQFLWPRGFSIHGVLQARILEWVAIPFSRSCYYCYSFPRFVNWRRHQNPSLKHCLQTFLTQRLKYCPSLFSDF